MIDFESKVISREVSQLLWEMEKTVGTAESCTGGRIAEALISIPGASKYFKGGIVCYVDEIKERLLNVDAQVLEEQTAVCEEVARQLVKGACHTLNTDYAIAATGFAGPTGGTPYKPVGTVWIAWATPWGTEAKRFAFGVAREREQITQRAVTAAIVELIKSLNSSGSAAFTKH